jgi:hypothetical protein
VRRFILMSLSAAALGAVLALGGCGSSEQLSDEAVQEIYETVGNAYSSPAYLPAYRRCVVGEIERLASPEEILDIADGSPSEQQEAAEDLLGPAERTCRRAHPRVIDPAAAPGELAPIRLRTGADVERELKEGGASAAEAACAKRLVRQLDDAKFIRFANATTDSEVDQAARVILPCIR